MAENGEEVSSREGCAVPSREGESSAPLGTSNDTELNPPQASLCIFVEWPEQRLVLQFKQQRIDTCLALLGCGELCHPPSNLRVCLQDSEQEGAEGKRKAVFESGELRNALFRQGLRSAAPEAEGGERCLWGRRTPWVFDLSRNSLKSFRWEEAADTLRRLGVLFKEGDSADGLSEAMLVCLALSSNNLTAPPSLPPQLQPSLACLQELKLCHNSIESLELPSSEAKAEVEAGGVGEWSLTLPQLQVLDLNYNRLQSLNGLKRLIHRHPRLAT